jgi:hypothetical protein
MSLRGSELEQLLREAEMSADELSDLLGRHPDEVVPWLRSSVRLPSDIERQVRWAVAIHERSRAFAAAGLEPCEWRVRHDRSWNPHDGDDVARARAEIEEHMTHCSVCQSHRAFHESQPVLPEPPLPASVRMMKGLDTAIRRLPVWLRPGGWSTVVVSALALFRVILGLLAGNVRLTGFTVLVLVGVAIVAFISGVAAGLAYRVVREPSLRFGRAGDYLTGVLTTMSYLLTMVGLVWLAGGRAVTQPSVDPRVLVGVALVGGLIAGHTVFRARRIRRS